MISGYPEKLAHWSKGTTMPSMGRLAHALVRRRIVAAGCVVGLCACQHTAWGQSPAAASSRLAPSPALIGTLSPELRARLVASPMAFFRFVNQAWTNEVCEAFRADVTELPTARLHGDAHVEQYAMTNAARGLDDFDDSARGPAIIDIVRFLGSLELAAAQRGWTASLPATIDAFLAGYRRGLEAPSYLPPVPAVVKRLRRAPIKSQVAFLSWAESLMQPMGEWELARIEAVWSKVAAKAVETDPTVTPAYMALKKVGWLRIGIGSALTSKLLLRIEGPSPASADDVVLEGKQMLEFDSDSCVSLPRDLAAFRVVQAIRQIGRLRPPFLLALPAIERARPDPRDWWVTAWDRSYKEVEIKDLASPLELRELAHDAGAQLGSSNLPEQPGRGAGERQAELRAVVRLEPRIRQVAHGLTAALVHAWESFRTQGSSR
jgi:hypothetical protein